MRVCAFCCRQPCLFGASSEDAFASAGHVPVAFVRLHFCCGIIRLYYSFNGGWIDMMVQRVTTVWLSANPPAHNPALTPL